VPNKLAELPSGQSSKSGYLAFFSRSPASISNYFQIKDRLYSLVALFSCRFILLSLYSLVALFSCRFILLSLYSPNLHYAC
jgi:hypothetical protein